MTTFWKLSSRKLSPNAEIDKSLMNTQQRLFHAMGPLPKIWGKIDEARKHSTPPEFSLDEVLSLLEQFVLMLGQVYVSFNFHRRTNFLVKLFKDGKKVHKILNGHEKQLASDPKQLFGRKFQTYLAKVIKCKKQAKELVGAFRDEKKK
jgi:hypothetical protein